MTLGPLQVGRLLRTDLRPVSAGWFGRRRTKLRNRNHRGEGRYLRSRVHSAVSISMGHDYFLVFRARNARVRRPTAAPPLDKVDYDSNGYLNSLVLLLPTPELSTHVALTVTHVIPHSRS